MPCLTYAEDEPQKEDNKWEAGFCAVTSALKNLRGNEFLMDILEIASEDSSMDVKALYKEHEESDLERLNEKLKDFSQDELRVIKTILNNKAL